MAVLIEREQVKPADDEAVRRRLRASSLRWHAGCATFRAVDGLQVEAMASCRPTPLPPARGSGPRMPRPAGTPADAASTQED